MEIEATTSRFTVTFRATTGLKEILNYIKYMYVIDIENNNYLSRAARLVAVPVPVVVK